MLDHERSAQGKVSFWSWLFLYLLLLLYCSGLNVQHGVFNHLSGLWKFIWRRLQYSVPGADVSSFQHGTLASFKLFCFWSHLLFNETLGKGGADFEEMAGQGALLMLKQRICFVSYCAHSLYWCWYLCFVDRTNQFVIAVNSQQLFLSNFFIHVHFVAPYRSHFMLTPWLTHLLCHSILWRLWPSRVVRRLQSLLWPMFPWRRSGKQWKIRWYLAFNPRHYLAGVQNAAQ